ncbi:EAL domain-containing protein [Methylomicrobium sp. Wu6]|uniref:EAL domain-containing protein n=1 Tax=Methylomicrobium sp. Wu6 TaxID=3107928 RepID=UPI002DD62216|nr:EAL domain-containing protein [Methylomicrobium sp. Wu6]MEC4750660.1 EAL domain-containing protein [Methylomicrobium sp. Wu6]
MLEINILLAIGYFLGGYFGTLLSIPPSHASPIWPAAGIAFAGMVTYGHKVIPGILAGAFMAQIFSFLDKASPDGLFFSLFVGSIASIAATLQAGLGAWLTRRYVGADNPLTDDRSILRFIALGGPVSCIFSASAGVITLHAEGALAWQDMPVSWITWWIGDTVGVLIFAPLLLCFIGVLRNRRSMRINSVALPLIILSLLVIVILHFGKQQEKQRIRSLFEEHCSLLHNALQNEFTRYTEINQYIKVFFDSSIDVSADEFKNYTKPLLAEHSDIQALEWIPRITATQRSTHEQSLGAAIYTQAPGNPSGMQSEYFPITYAEPFDANARARGLDISSKPNSFAAIRKAGDTAKTTLSGVIRLVQDPSNQASAAIYTPVYQAGRPIDTLAQRRAALRGFVANVFQVHQKIDTVKNQYTRLQLLLKITDFGDTLFDEMRHYPASSLDFPKLEKTLPLHIADRTWSIMYAAAPEFYNEQLNWNIWWLILGCFMFTGMTGLGLLMLTGRTMQTEDVVKIRTRELENEIAERKTAEIKIQRITQLYAVLSHCNQSIVRCATEADLFRQICNDSVQFGGMQMVWIGLTDPKTQRINPVAGAGDGAEFLKDVYISADPANSLSQGPVGAAIRENRPIWCQNFACDPMAIALHERGISHEWRASAALPIQQNGAAVGVFCLYANKVDAFDEEVRDLLLKMAWDIGFAMDNFDREDKRRQAEQSLQKSEQFLRTVIETEPECVKVLDQKGDLINMNAAGLNMLEVDSLEIAQQHKLINFLLPKYRDAFIALHKRVMNGQNDSLEFEVVGRKGTRRWLETYAAPLPGPSGAVTMMLAVTRDISARKRAEQALQESENRLMLAFKGSSDAPWDWDLENNRLYYSPQWWRMLGYDIDELQSDAKLWQSLVHPDDIDFIQLDLREALNSGQSMHAVELRLRHKDGHYVPILERSFISRNKDGKVVRISGTNMDLTERRHEQNLEELRGFMLECITSSMPLAEVLDAITHKAESLKPGAHCAMLLLDDSGLHLRLAAAPSLPNFYKSCIDGMPVGDNMGCCGYAASKGQSAIADDIAGDPCCAGMRMPLEQAGLASWWSEPIRGSGNRVLGTFAVYQRTPAMPDDYDRKLIETVTHYAALTIDRKRAETQLKLAAKVFEQSQEGFMITDAKRNILRVNPAFTAITGYSEEDAIGKSASMLSSGRHDGEFYRNLWETIDAHNFWQGEIWNRRKNGEVYPELLNISVVRDSFGNVSEYVGVFADITQLKASEAQLEFLAHHDMLTSLPNRLRLFFRLEHSIDTAKREGMQIALLMLDLDRFKDVNDSFGHLVGDQLLQLVANKLVNRVRDIDTVSRLGGDEFTVVLENISQPEDAARIAQAIIADLSEPWSIPHTGEVLIGASIGISLYPQHGHTPELLLQNADAALYKAKEGGRNRFAFYSNEFTEAARQRIDMEGRLRRALLQNELLVYYQPQIDIATGKIVGAEALARWQDPVEGMIPPDRFIPIAEQTGLIQPIGAWVLKETCRQGKEWLDKGFKPISLAVNVSQHQMRQSDVSALVADVLRETGFPAEYLEMELTESGLMERQSDVMEILKNLRAQGVRLAIDDFGTGYSSLAYLKRFPLNVLKIDKNFIDDIPVQQDDMEIAATIIAMGHILGFKVLAEGVETLEQLAFLKGKGCDLYQGFLVSHPLSAAEFSAQLADVAMKNA